MTQILWRSLLAFSLAMVLSACQAPAKQISEPVIDQFAVSTQVFDTYVEDNQLVLITLTMSACLSCSNVSLQLG